MGTRFRHALPPFAASLLGRLMYAAEPLILFGAVLEGTGSNYSIAGSVSAIFGLVAALTLTVRATLIDRYGPSLVMALLGLGYVTSTGGLVLALSGNASVWAYWALAAAAGVFAPPMGILMRVLWADLVGPTDLARALGRDAAAEETVYVVGPIIAGAILAFSSPMPALLATASVMALASVLLGRAAGKVSLVAGERPTSTASWTVILRNLIPVLLPAAAFGVAVSMVWLAAVALPGTADLPGGQGFLLTLMAAGSALGALGHGRLAQAADPLRRLLLCAFMMTAILMALGAFPHAAAWMVLLPALGASAAPVLVNSYLLAGRVPVRLRARSNAWIGTAVNAASALGTAGAGLLIDAQGSGRTLLVTALVAALLTTGAVVIRRRSGPVELVTAA